MVYAFSSQPAAANTRSIRSWPHYIATFTEGLETASLQSSTDAKTIQKAGQKSKSKSLVVKADIDKIFKTNRQIKLLVQYESILVPDFHRDFPEDERLRHDVWKAIKECPNLFWVVVTNNPTAITAMLPPDWGKNGYPNVCIVVVLDDSPEVNRERIDALRQLRARLRGLWIRPTFDISEINHWYVDIDWVIADSSALNGSGGLPGFAIEWGYEVHHACRAHGIPFFHNRRDIMVCSQSTREMAPTPEHPFGPDIDFDLMRLPLAECTNNLKTGETLPRPIMTVESVQLEAPAQVADIALAPRAEDADIPPANLSEEAEIFDDPEEKIPTEASVMEVEVLTKLSRFKILNRLVHDGIRASLKAGLALLEIRIDELWREGGFPSWDSYCETFLETGRSYINRIIKHAEIHQWLQKSKPPEDSHGTPILPTNEFQTRPLARLKDERKLVKAWKLSVKRSAGMPTAATVAEVVSEINAEAPPAKQPGPSREKQRKEIIGRLREAAEAQSSWDQVLELIILLEKS
jgi:protein gp37